MSKTSNPRKGIPVILDTDIGTDIDDTWALTLMLKSPELDVKLIVTETGDTTCRGKIVAKMLEIAGRTDIPLGIGVPLQEIPIYQAPWVADYELSGYPGAVYEDGVGALIDTILSSPEPITLICIGPVPNISAALDREPRIAERARFVGMHGSIRRGYGGSHEVSAEYNVRAYPIACRKAFAAPWEVTITPLDTCGIVKLRGGKYRAVHECENPLVQALIENYRIAVEQVALENPECMRQLDVDLASEARLDTAALLHVIQWMRQLDVDVASEGTTLFDTVAIYLAFSEELLRMEELGIRATDEGYTVIDDHARMIRCATEWRDLLAFEDFLVQRLTGRS